MTYIRVKCIIDKEKNVGQGLGCFHWSDWMEADINGFQIKERGGFIWTVFWRSLAKVTREMSLIHWIIQF